MKIKLDSRSSRIAVLGQRRATKAYPVMTQAITTHLTSCLRSVDSKFGTTAMNSCETFSLSSMFQGCPHVTLVEQGCPSVPQQLELNGSSLSICVGQSERNGPQLGQQHNKNMWFSFPGQQAIQLLSAFKCIQAVQQSLETEGPTHRRGACPCVFHRIEPAGDCHLFFY